MVRKKFVGSFTHPFLLIVFVVVVTVNIFIAGYLNSKELDTDVSLAYGSSGGRSGKCVQFLDYCSSRKPCCDSRQVCRRDPGVLSGAKVCVWAGSPPKPPCGSLGERCCSWTPKCNGVFTCISEKNGDFCRYVANPSK